MDAAWHSAVAQGYAAQPIVEMLIPSVVDDTLAPRGAHVASLFCQQFDPDADWATLKEPAVQAIFDVVQSHCPNFRDALLGWRALSPADLESEFGLVGGDIFHGQLSLDQLFSMRPLMGYAKLPRAAEGPVPLRLGRASGRRRDRRAGAQRGAGNRSRPSIDAAGVC